MHLNFFPSRRISFYMARMFLQRTLAVLAALVLVLQVLDLLGQSGKVLGYPGNGQDELLRYVALRLPQLVARFLPFSVLLGTLITLATLNQNSEVIAMKAAGISAHQILAPLVVASLGVAAVSFSFNEAVVAPATRQLNAWEGRDFGPVPRDANVAEHVWVTSGEDLVEVERVIGRGAATVLEDVEIHQRAGGTLMARITAERGAPEGDGWRLTDVTRFDLGTGALTRRPSLRTLEGVEPRQFTYFDVDPDEHGFLALRRAIADLKIAGRPTQELEAGLWHKLSGPLSAVLMPLLAGVAGFGLARSGQLFVRAVIGMALGFAYFVADNFALAMGNLGAYPPLLAAWAPFALFLLIGEAVLIRTEE